MIRTQDKIIGENTYTVTQFGATKSLKMLHRVGKFIADPLSKLAGEIKPGAGIADQNITTETLGKAVQAFFVSCNENEFESTVKELITSTTRNNKPINFEIDFSGQIGELLKVLAFVLEVNYKDFFSGIGGLQK
jgi:hypothetical protein